MLSGREFNCWWSMKNHPMARGHIDIWFRGLFFNCGCLFEMDVIWANLCLFMLINCLFAEDEQQLVKSH